MNGSFIQATNSGPKALTRKHLGQVITMKQIVPVVLALIPLVAVVSACVAVP